MAWTVRVLVWLCVLSCAPVVTRVPRVAAQDDAGVRDSAKGDEAFKKALARLKSTDPAERALAADEMGRRGYRFRREIADTLRPLLLSDPDSVVRAASGRALGRLGAREAVPELIKALGDRSAEVRVVAAAALWRLPDPSAVPALLERAHDGDRAVREWSALALGVAADPRAVPELIRLLGDAERPVRLAAIRGLGRINRPEGLKPLVAYLADAKRDDEEKDEVINSISSIEGPGRTSALLELLNEASGDLQQRLRVIVALNKVGDAQALPVLRKLQRDESRQVREVASQAHAAVLARAKNKPEVADAASRP